MKRITGRILCGLLCLIMLLPIAACAQTETVVITCTGDAMLGCNETVRPHDYAFNHYIDLYGYDYPFEYFREMFENDDITLLNLEVVLTDTTNSRAAKSRYTFRGTTDYAKILSRNSVEAVSMANNHTLDYDQKGFNSTTAALDAEGVAWFGIDEEHVYTWIWERGDIRIGFIGVLPHFWAESSKNQNRMQKAAQKLRDDGCQVVVACLHCGTEGIAKHDSIHNKYEGVCLSLGADLIIGNHPHVPQGINVTKNGVTHLYSIGNFAFGGNTGVDEVLSCQDGYVAQFTLTFEDGVYLGHQLTIWPIHITGSYPVNDYRPVPVTGAEADEVMRRIQADTDFPLNPYVEGQGAVQDFVPAGGK